MADIKRALGFPSVAAPTPLYVYFGAVLLGLLSVETVPLPVQVYIAPATSILAFLGLVGLLYRARRIRRSPILYAVTLFVGYSLVLSILFLVADLLTLNVGLNRVWLFTRQVIALSIGASVFYVLRRVLLQFSEYGFAKLVALGSIPSLLAAWMTIIWQSTGYDVIAIYPLAVRKFAPTGYEGLKRTTGFMSEPSHFSFFLVVVLLPAIMIGYHKKHTKGDETMWWFVAGIGALGAFIWTFSTSGVLMLSVFVGAFALLSGRWKASLGSIAVCAIVGGLFMVFLPETYLAQQLTRLVTGNWKVSILTRFYSTMGPIVSALTSVHGFFGYGLGGTNAHIHDIIPARGVDGLKAVSWNQAVNLKTLIGRVIAETGIPGLTLFLLMIGAAYAELARLHNYSFAPWEWSYQNRVIGAAIVATVFGHGLAMGSFAIPFLWMWLAVVDSKNLQP